MGEGLISGLVVGGAIAAGIIFTLMMVSRFLYVCRPHEVLIFSGGKNVTADGQTRGFRVVHGGRSWRTPVLETVDHLDVRTIPIELVTHQAYSSDGIPLSVRAIANIKVTTDTRYIGNAIERFLGRDPAEIRRVGRETLEGTLRGVLATLTPEQVNEDRLRFAQSLTEEVEDDFNKLGLHLDVLKIQHVSDEVE